MAAGAATERIKLGTGVCLVVERDPIVTAKAAASVDRLTGGRLLFGVGAGWNLEEMRNHGTDPRRRFSIMRERVEAIKEIWTTDEATYHGEHVDFDRDLVLAEAAHGAAPADHRRRPRQAGARPRARLRRRVDAEPDRRRRQDQRPDRAAARGRRGRRPRPDPDHARQRHRPTPRCSTSTSAPGVHRALFWVAQGDEADLERRLDRLSAAVEVYESA